MGIINGAISFGSNFNIGAKGPIDARMRVEKIADLTAAWTTEMPAYKGMAVTVMEDANIYVLNGDDATVAGNWKVIGGDTAADLSQVKTDVAANTAAIKTINGDASTNGSIAKALADAKADATAKDTALKTALVGNDNTEDTIKYAEKLANDAADAAATAKSTADAKVAGVTGSTLVDAKVDASKNIVLTDSKALTDAVLKAGTALQEVTGENAITITDKNAISLKTSDKGNVKFTADSDGLSANVTIPDATVKGVSDDDPILTLMSDGKISAEVGITYDSANKSIYLLGKTTGEDNILGSVDCADFIKDGMLEGSALYTATSTTGKVTINKKEYNLTGLTVGHTYIVLVWNTDADKDAMTIDVTTLIDVYTAGDGLNLTDHTFSVDTTKIATKVSVDTLSGKVTDLEGFKDREAGFATAAQGTFADNAVRTVTTGSANGTISVKTGAEDAVDVAVKGLGSAAYKDADEFDAAGAASAVLGTAADTSDKNTVYGAKAAAAAASAKVDGLNVTDNVSAAVAGITVTVNETSGKVSKPVVAVTPGTIADGDTGVVTGGAVYTAVEAAKKAASDALVWNEISNN